MSFQRDFNLRLRKFTTALAISIIVMVWLSWYSLDFLILKMFTRLNVDFKVLKKRSEICFFLKEFSRDIARSLPSRIIQLFIDGAWIEALTRIAWGTIGWCNQFSSSLFVCLTWLASMSIQAIIEDTQNSLIMFTDVTGNQTRKWQQSYYLIMDFVDGISQSFGTYLFLLITKLFLTCFIYMFDIANYLYNGEISSLLEYFGYLVANLIQMSLILAGTHNMVEKVYFIITKTYFELITWCISLTG